MTFDMSQFHQVFFDETAEHLVNMESLLLAIDVNQPESEDLNAIFRAAHSIKGALPRLVLPIWPNLPTFWKICSIKSAKTNCR